MADYAPIMTPLLILMLTPAIRLDYQLVTRLTISFTIIMLICFYPLKGILVQASGR